MYRHFALGNVNGKSEGAALSQVAATQVAELSDGERPRAEKAEVTEEGRGKDFRRRHKNPMPVQGIQNFYCHAIEVVRRQCCQLWRGGFLSVEPLDGFRLGTIQNVSDTMPILIPWFPHKFHSNTF